jgi:hypothetical protein
MTLLNSLAAGNVDVALFGLHAAPPLVAMTFSLSDTFGDRPGSSD